MEIYIYCYANLRFWIPFSLPFGFPKYGEALRIVTVGDGGLL